MHHVTTRVVINRQTHMRLGKYRIPHCACPPRVNHSSNRFIAIMQESNDVAADAADTVLMKSTQVHTLCSYRTTLTFMIIKRPVYSLFQLSWPHNSINNFCILHAMKMILLLLNSSRCSVSSNMMYVRFICCKSHSPYIFMAYL